MKYLLLTLAVILVVIPQAHAASVFKDVGVGITIEKSLHNSGKLKYSDVIPYDNATSYYGEFVKSGDDIKRKTIIQHNNIGPLQFTKNYYSIVDPPSAIQNRLPLITIVSNLDSYHTTAQMHTSEAKVASDAKAHGIIIQSSTLRWVDTGCREAKISYSQWQVLLPDTMTYLKSGCTITKINTIVNQTKILTKHDLPTSMKYKLEKWNDNIKKNCLQKRNSCTVENRQVTTMGDSR